MTDTFKEIGSLFGVEARVQASPNRRIRNPSPMPSLGRRGILGQPSPDT